MTPLRSRIGFTPYKYTVDGDGPNAEFQVTLTGPAGPAVIHQIDGKEAYEIETSFRGEPTRMHYGSKSAREALEKVVALNNTRLTSLGVKPPPLVSPQFQTAVVAGFLLIVALIVWGIVALFSGGDDTTPPLPETPATHGPMVKVTVRGDGKYSDAECEALRVVGISDSSEASDAVVEYTLHCKTKTIYDSPAPTLETTR